MSSREQDLSASNLFFHCKTKFLVQMYTENWPFSNSLQTNENTEPAHSTDFLKGNNQFKKHRYKYKSHIIS